MNLEQEYNLNLQSLKSYLYRLTADRQEAEDLAQDTFVKAMEKIHQFEGKSSLKTWLFSIATNLAIDLLRKRKRWPVNAQDLSRELAESSKEIENGFLKVFDESAQGRYEIKEHIDFCFTCISKVLPIDEQVSLILKDIYDFKIEEITAIIHLSEGKVKHLLHSGRSSMNKIFEKRCALVSKQGVCYQCSELNGYFNPQQSASEELNKLELVKERDYKSQEELYELRAALVKAIDPLSAQGADLQDIIMQCTRKAIKEIS